MRCSLEHRLSERRHGGNLRQLKKPNKLIDFASNNYLGLAQSQELAALISQESFGFGSTGSRLLTGNTTFAEQLEREIAHFHGYEAGLLFNCGYMANLGVLSAVATAEDSIFYDIQVHASIHDGIRLSSARAYPFRHNDMVHLEKRLNQCSCRGKRYICVEAVYSTDGSRAPLTEISGLASKYEARLIVDEAHAVGVLGPHGRGLTAEYGLTNQVFAQVVTFGKALGVHGAIVLGSSLLREYLINFARSFIYTTALPLGSLIAIKSSYALFPKLDAERRKLGNFISKIASVSGSQTPIQPIQIKGNRAAKVVAEKMVCEGYDVRALLSPTVKRGREMLRICLHAFNSDAELTDLFRRLQWHLKSS